MSISVAIADDHQMVIKGIQVMLQDSTEIKITDVYHNGEALMEGLAINQPDVLILDIQMPGASGAELTPDIVRLYPDIGILALTNLDQSFHVKKMISNGAMGYLLKSVGQEILWEAIKSVHQRIQFIDPSLRNQLLQDMFISEKNKQRHPELTPREFEILQLIGNNHTSQEIADKLFLSKRTIDYHRVSLLFKFEVKNASGLIKKAIELGMITP